MPSPTSDFRFQPSIDKRQVRDFATLTFVTEAANILLLSLPGVGKTNRAVAFGLRAIEDDRLLHHSHVLNIHGESYRLRETKQAGLFGVSSARSRSTERLKTPLDRTAKGWVNHH